MRLGTLGDMAAKPVLTLEQLFQAIKAGAPPTADDVCVAADGRRLGTPEKVRAWIDELNMGRAAAQARGEGLL